jgi:hypothetical protein
MNITKFVETRPFLYHLTDVRNLSNITSQAKLLSTKAIIEGSNHVNPAEYLRTKRRVHDEISINGHSYHIRDQRPISEIVLARSLTNGWTTGDFIAHLNCRVFLWPTISRLERHFKRYENENPIILRFNTSDIVSQNNVEFCRLNSGATRCSSHWGGNAPERGPETFQIAESYLGTHSSVAEVTIPEFCNLPELFWTSNHPHGQWSVNA